MPSSFALTGAPTADVPLTLRQRATRKPLANPRVEAKEEPRNLFRSGAYYAANGWLRGQDSNLRPLGYEPNELPLLHPATKNGTESCIPPSPQSSP